MVSGVHVSRRGLTLAAAALLALAMLPMVPSTATLASATTPGQAGTVQRGTAVFSDSFGTDPPVPTPMALDEYGGSANQDTNANGQAYRADADWLPGYNACNGWVMNSTSVSPTGDSGCQNVGTPNGGSDGNGTPRQAWWFLQQMSYALGTAEQQEGETVNPATNNAVSSESNAMASELQPVQMESVADGSGDYATQGIAGHYYEVAIYVAQVHCHRDNASWTDSDEMLELLYHDASGSHSENLLPSYDVCTSGTRQIAAANTPIYTAFLVSAPFQLPDDGTLGLRLSNNQTDYHGNDVAFDLPEIFDVTPQLDKSFAPSTIQAGSVSTLTFTVTNTIAPDPGASFRTSEPYEKAGWSFTDSLPADVTVAATPNVRTNCQAADVTASGSTITVTNGDLDGAFCTIRVDVTSSVVGQYVNDATNITSIVGLNPPGPAPLDVESDPALTLVKTASRNNVTAEGQVVTYTFRVTNSGGVPISDLTIDDSITSGTGALSAITCNTTSLAVGAYTTCTATYTVTEQDIINGTDLVDSAHASGYGLGQPIGVRTDSNDDSATVTITQTPHLTLLKSVTPDTGVTKGTVLTYQFNVLNDGNEPIDNLVINDPLGTPSATTPGFNGASALTITCPVTQLNIEESTTCTATYTVVQSDVDEGFIDNTATAAGTDPASSPVTSEPSVANLLLTRISTIDLTKTHAAVASPAKAGNLVTFLYTVTNTGNTTLNSITIDDNMSGLSTPTCPAAGSAWPGTAGQLLPGQSVNCSAVYTLKQADVDAGQAVNPQAIAIAVPSDSTDPVESDPQTDLVPLPASPGLTLVKSASPNDPPHFIAGQVITYTFVVTNTGNVTLSDITVDETDFSGAGPVPSATCPGGVLAPGAQLQCTATYTLLEDDIEAGTLTNTAVATGTLPQGGTEDSNPSDVTLPSDPEPAFTFVKTGSVVNNGTEIDYLFTVTNTGNTVLENVTVTEVSFSGKGLIPTVNCPAGPVTLVPGAIMTCTATYTIQPGDSGTTITNQAAANADPPGQVPLTRRAQAQEKLGGGGNADTGGSVAGSPVLPLGIGAAGCLAGVAIAMKLAIGAKETRR